MSARRLCIAALAIPVITMSLSCMSGRPIPMAAEPLPSDRMMAIGQTFERQGRFAEARYVYQQVLEQDPVSPAAERLLAVVAAADVTNAQNLPVERLMSVGEFYERHGNVSLAHGVYKQILRRQPDFEPARERIKAIAAHEEHLAGQADLKSGRPAGKRELSPLVSAALNSSSSQRSSESSRKLESQNQLYPVADAAMSLRKTADDIGQSAAVPADGEEQRVSPVSGTQESVEPHDDRSAAMDKPDQWRARNTSTSVDRRRGSLPDDSEDVFELPSIVVSPALRSHSSVQQTSAEVTVAATGVDESLIPPAPADIAQQIPRPSPEIGQIKTPEPNADNRVADLWQDKPLGELKASISLKIPEPEKLRDTELQRLTQAAPHMAARGSMVQTVGQSRPWMLAGYEWEAPATRHLPLLFEEPNLERMGYTCGLGCNLCGYECGPYLADCVQPIVSGAHFFGRVPFIPYMCGLDPPCEPIYTLGVDRPGSPVPYRRHLIPVTFKALLYQAGAMVGIAYGFP